MNKTNRSHPGGTRHSKKTDHQASRAAGARGKRWSGQVTRESDALDLEPDIFKSSDAEAIAQSLKRSAVRSRRRKGSAFQSAMSMLNFYVNRAGRNLPKARRTTLERAKQELRLAFGRDPQGSRHSSSKHG